ncbi:hypothetical protein [Streptomyces violens]|uniref:hypothetical protein n=1 Tax=Streptomyces violens TaxID=66377 RepID=UPI0004C27207|nr:hypothetical protein [Streptomyces violens]
MRMLLKVQLDTSTANDAIKNGTLPTTIENALANLRPEAAYFTTQDGFRTAFIFFDMQDPSQMPKTGEPFFLELGAKVQYTPVMNAEDLRKGLAALSGG